MVFSYCHSNENVYNSSRLVYYLHIFCLVYINEGRAAWKSDIS